MNVFLKASQPLEVSDKTIAIILNSPYLGGGEKSIIIQTSKLSVPVAYYLPYFENQSECELMVNFIKSYNDFPIRFFKYPQKLFSISRSSPKTWLSAINPLLMLKNFVGFYRIIRNISKRYDLIWCNGNKVGVVFYFFNKIIDNRFFIWHFRDYPSQSFIFKLLWRFISIFNNTQTIFLANSKSVECAIQKAFFHNVPTDFVYNPIGMIAIKKRTNRSKTIGIVSMMAPWKGIHEIIKFASVYKQKLTEIGVEKINIYGGSLYQTNGPHSFYLNELKEMVRVYDNKMIEFIGIKPPEIIYNNIDLLIHSSLRPEPFGRVIIEAASFKIPILSTGLGGAGELCRIIGAETFDLSNYKVLFIKIKNLLIGEKKCQYQDLGDWDQNINEKLAVIVKNILVNS